jgi:predicted nucleic acid-binding protein
MTATISLGKAGEELTGSSRKLRMTIPEIHECPVTLETHLRGLDLTDRYGFSVYDSMIVAAALLAGRGDLGRNAKRIVKEKICASRAR